MLVAVAVSAMSAPSPADKAVPEVSGPAIWKDVSKDPQARAADLVRRLSLQEKVGLIQMKSPPAVYCTLKLSTSKVVLAPPVRAPKTTRDS